jgi:hypothetical protein
MLLEASRIPTEEDEKYEIVAMEQRVLPPFVDLLVKSLKRNFSAAGMDALRGGFGAVGSIIRARSVRRMSSMSSMGRSDSHRLPFHSASAYDGMQRYQRMSPSALSRS